MDTARATQNFHQERRADDSHLLGVPWLTALNCQPFWDYLGCKEPPVPGHSHFWSGLHPMTDGSQHTKL